MKLPSIIKINIGSGELSECKMSKEEFLAKTKVEHTIYNAEALDYDDESGDLTIRLSERIKN